MRFDINLPSSHGGYIAATEKFNEVSAWLQSCVSAPYERHSMIRGEGGFERDVSLMKYAIATGFYEPVKACRVLRAEGWMLALAQISDANATIVFTIDIEDETLATQCRLMVI